MTNASGWVTVGVPYASSDGLVVDAVCGCGTQGRVRWLKGAMRSQACFACTRRKPSHGLSSTRTYRCWQSMRDRCNNPNATAYRNYGARGIRVCRRWARFENFVADMGEIPPGITIGRKNNNGDYAPINCRWETRREQNANTRQNVLVSYAGETKIVAEWARTLGVDVQSLRFRLRSGMPTELAFTLPYDDLVNTRRRANDFITIEHLGESLTLWQWSERTGIHRTTLQDRIARGWSPERALTTPARKLRPHRD